MPYHDLDCLDYKLSKAEGDKAINKQLQMNIGTGTIGRGEVELEKGIKPFKTDTAEYEGRTMYRYKDYNNKDM